MYYRNKHCRLLLTLVFAFLICTFAAHASPFEPYVVLEGRAANLVGQSISIQDDGSGNGYISFNQGRGRDLASLVVDIGFDRTYEFWLYMKGNANVLSALYSQDGKAILHETVQAFANNWRWVKVKQESRLISGRYYFTISEPTAPLQVGKVLVKTVGSGDEGNVSRASNYSGANAGGTNFGIMATTSDTAAPTLPNQSPWIKQGLNPFATLLQNGSEFVSPTSGTLTIAVTDLVVPGRGGVDLTIGRHYTSKTDGSVKNETYLVGDWDFALPRVTETTVTLPNGSECYLYDDEVKMVDSKVDDKTRTKVFTTSVNSYFRLIRYETLESETAYGPIYRTSQNILLLADGTAYIFWGTLSQQLSRIYKGDFNNSIQFSYDTGGKLNKITDTLGRIYNINRYASEIDIVRAEDNKTMVTYGISGDQLESVTDALGRVTRYDYNLGQISHITHPSGKSSWYSYDSLSCYDGTQSYYKFFLNEQAIYSNNLVKKTAYDGTIDAKDPKVIMTEEYDEKGLLRVGTYYFTDDHGMVIRTKTIDEQANRVIRTTYTDYDVNKQKLKETVYYGNIYEEGYDSQVNHPAIAIDQHPKEDRWILSQESWCYDIYGNLTYYQDPEGYETMVTYANTESDKKFTRVLAGNGGQDAFYDNSALSNGSVHDLPSGELKIRKYLNAEKTSFDAAETYYQYDAKGNLLQSKTLVITDPQKLLYPTTLTAQDRKWTVIQNTDYDQYGNCGKQIFDATGQAVTITYKYDPTYSAYLTEKTQSISRNLVNDAGQLAGMQAVTTRYDYDYKTGLQTKITDPRSRELIYEYDDLGRVKKVIYPKVTAGLDTPEATAAYEEVVYDDAGKKASAYDVERRQVIVHYFDGLGREVKAETYSGIDANGNGVTRESTTQTTYNWLNKPLTVTDTNGKVTTYEYDLFGRPTKVTTFDGNVTTTQYDDLAKTSTTVAPDNTTSTVTFDRKGQKVSEAIQNGSNILTFSYIYDGFGNVIKTTDAKDQEMGYVYNGLNQLTQILYPDQWGKVYESSPTGPSVKNTYDSLGNLQTSVNRKGQTVRYDYNEYGQLITVTMPYSKPISYYYNELGQLIKVEQDGFSKKYAYDERGRMYREDLTVSLDASSIITGGAYTGNINTSTTNSSSTNTTNTSTTNTSTASIGPKTYTTTYRYNKNNAITSVVYPASAGTLNYSYNDLSRISGVSWLSPGLPQTVNLASSVTYANTGHLTGMTYGNGVAASFNYNYINGEYVPDNIAYSQGGKQIGVFDYRYDKLGNIIRANNHQYTYDPFGQLTGWKYLKENDRVLLGEEVIWDKEMKDNTGLTLNQIMVTDSQLTTGSQLQLAIEPAQSIIAVSKLLNESSLTKSEVQSDTNLGYTLKVNRTSYDETFDDPTRIDTLKSQGYNCTTGTVTMAQNQGDKYWVPVFNSAEALKLPKSAVTSINNVLNTFSINFSYYGTDYFESRDWQPDPYTIKWNPLNKPMVIGAASLIDMKKINLEIRDGLHNAWDIFGGWGNWKHWIKVVINGKYVGMVSFDTTTDTYIEQVQTLTVDLEAQNLMNTFNGLTIDLYFLVNRWGEGPTDGCDLKSLKVTAIEKKVYPVNQTLSKTYTQAIPLTVGNTYRMVATETVPTSTKVWYELWNASAKVKDLTNNTDFTVTADGSYYLHAYVQTTDMNATAEIKNVAVNVKRVYPVSVVVQLKPVTLTDGASTSGTGATSSTGTTGTGTTNSTGTITSKSIALDYQQTLPAGTRIDYTVSNDGGTTWQVPQYQSSINKYIANFTNPGSSVVVKATLYSDSLQKETPTISNIRVTAWDSAKYNASGYVTRLSTSVAKASRALILELHGMENGGKINPTMNLGGVIVTGVRTTASELIGSGNGSNNNNTGDPTNTDLATDPTLLQQATALRQEVANKNLQTYYYRFDLPANIVVPFNAQLTINLNSTADKLQSPSVYSYILLDNYLKHYSTGTFENAGDITPTKRYTFDQVRLGVTGKTPTGTTASYQLLSPVLSAPVNATPDSVISLGKDVSSVDVRGTFTTSNTTLTPSTTRITLTAIGETPLKNNLDATSTLTINPSMVGTVSTAATVTASTDRIEGNYSLEINNTTTGTITYTMNANQIVDVTKLPLVQIWVKPLTDKPIAFLTYDMTDARDEQIKSDSDQDGLFEVGTDLIKDKWNLLLVNLSNTSNGITKDAKGLKIKADSGVRVLVDGVDSLPLNEVTYIYDKAGNRETLIENGIQTTYIYEMGTNRLKQRYNATENVTYTYDADGNLTRQDVTSNGNYYWFDYTFNELNQLIAVRKNNALIAEYFYDHVGLRYKKVDYVAGKTTIYVYGQGKEPIYEEIYTNINKTMAVSKISYINLDVKRVARIENESIMYYFNDRLNSTRIVIDNGGLYKNQDYDPFGGDFSTIGNEKYKFTGKEEDDMTGLYYYNARYYDPIIGRFINEDPGKDNLNWFVYCENDPLKNIDFDGKYSYNANDYNNISKTKVMTTSSLKLTSEGQVAWAIYLAQLSKVKESISFGMRGANVAVTGGKMYLNKGSLSGIGNAITTITVPLAMVDLMVNHEQQVKINQLGEISKLISLSEKSAGFTLEIDITHVIALMKNGGEWEKVGEGDLKRYFIIFSGGPYFKTPSKYELDEATYMELFNDSEVKK